MSSKKIIKKGKLRKKQNIQLLRRLAIIYHRTILITKIIFFIFISSIIFTDYFKPLQNTIIKYFYDITASMGLVLENVVIVGKVNCSEQSILNALHEQRGTPIFSVNIKMVQQNLENLPWIKIAAVKRKLPSTIQILLLEKIPTAIWQYNHQLFLIDDDGSIITDGVAQFHSLLHIIGKDANVHVIKLLNDLRPYQALITHIIAATRYGERRWDLNLQQNITIKLPTTDVNIALQYLFALYQAQKLFNQNYKTIDLRNNHKYYIEKYTNTPLLQKLPN